jgi:hypothetical protein
LTIFEVKWKEVDGVEKEIIARCNESEEVFGTI